MAEKCPRCGSEVEMLLGVDPGFRNKVNISGQKQVVPDKICGPCYQELSDSVSQMGSLFGAKEKFKEAAKLSLWKSRINLLRRARSLMAKKAYGEAVASYEKYLKIIETVFGSKLEQLNPETFKEKAATKELTVVCSVFWDLIRVYDTNEKYRVKQTMIATKLAQFAPYTPMLVEMIRQAEAYKRRAKNTELINKLVRQMANRRAKCFIATSAYGDELAPEVEFLRLWRDSVLLESERGRKWVDIYYRFSPQGAALLDKLSFLKPFVRLILTVLIFCISKISSKNLPIR